MSYMSSNSEVDLIAQAFSVVDINHKDFEINVLEPRGILINNSFARLFHFDPFSHFKTPEPKTDVPHAQHYRSFPRLSKTILWVEAGDPDFTAMMRRRYDVEIWRGFGEAAFEDLAHSFLLKKDDVCMPFETPDGRCWTADKIRKFDPTCMADGNYWKQPPILDQTDETSRAEYDLDVAPDARYWLTLRGFDSKLRPDVHSCTLVCKDVCCPYFTIEFRKHAKEDLLIARRRLAVTGAQALYNRWLLRNSRLRIEGTSWTSGHWAHIKHYGVILAGQYYTFWCISPEKQAHLGNKWTGCTMQKVFDGDMSSLDEDIKEFANWINEIHRWGMMEHAHGCEEDVMVSLGIRMRRSGAAMR